MDYEKLSTSILGAIENRPGDIGAYEDLFSLCQAWAETDFTAAHRANKQLKDMCDRMMDKVPMSQVEGFYSLWRRGLLFEAPYDFDSYLTYIELDRKLEKRFYQPRKHYLKRYVDAYQKILDGELDFLSISMPKRAGKSQLGINFTNMLSGKFPEKATLMEGTGDDLVNSFYKGCLEYLQTPSEYLFYDVFPESKLVQTNADTKTLNLMNKSRFRSFLRLSYGLALPQKLIQEERLSFAGNFRCLAHRGMSVTVIDDRFLDTEEPLLHAGLRRHVVIRAVALD
jgi:hypothetical protein